MVKQDSEVFICRDISELVGTSRNNRPETLAEVINRDVHEHKVGVNLNIPMVPVRQRLLEKFGLAVREGKVVPL